MQTITLQTSTIFIGTGLMRDKNIWQSVLDFNHHVVFLSDDTVAPLYLETLKKTISSQKETTVIIQSGEQFKTRETKQFIEDEMQKAGCGRDTTIVALGGGVITDLAGFIAATYCRGITSIYCPTTLLAMVDAAIGGKTGVNTPFGKNLIGSFYDPKVVVCDIASLKTLSHDHILEGLVETIKHALVYDADFFTVLEQDQSLFFPDNSMALDCLENLVVRSCQIKCDVVSQDHTEKNLRQILNLGHTVGHAIETAFEYQISHGQAVLMGLSIENHLAYSVGYLPEMDYYRIQDFLECIVFSKQFSLSSIDKEKIKSLMCLDKKNKNKIPHFVLLDKIGKVHQEAGQYSFALPALESYLEGGWIRASAARKR